MRRIVITAAAATLLLTPTACGSDDKPTAKPTTDDFTQGETTPPAPQTKQVPWGQPAEVLGTGLRKLRVTPLGLLYHKGPYNSGLEGPENGWYAAVAVKVEAVDSAESVASGGGSGGFQWRGGNQTISSSDGNTGGSPWVGAVNEFGTDAPIEPGSPEVGIESFDVPAKGGRLLYVSPQDASITSWEMPKGDQGTGLDKVRQRIKKFT